MTTGARSVPTFFVSMLAFGNALMICFVGHVGLVFLLFAGRSTLVRRLRKLFCAAKDLLLRGLCAKPFSLCFDCRAQPLSNTSTNNFILKITYTTV